MYNVLTRRSFCLALVSTAIALTGLSAARAADTKKADVTGTWKYETKARDGSTRETTLKFKQDGEKLTGTISGRNGKETEIKDGSVKGDEISFKLTRTNQNGQENTTTYTGKVEGDTIKGKMEMSGGNGRTRDFEAKRAKDKEKETK